MGELPEYMGELIGVYRAVAWSDVDTVCAEAVATKAFYKPGNGDAGLRTAKHAYSHFQGIGMAPWALYSRFFLALPPSSGPFKMECMTPLAIPRHTDTISSSLPRFLEGGTEAVLLIHGFTGSPADFVYLGSRLNENGYTVSIPRLPGHGTNGEDFLRTGWKDWLGHACDSYVNLVGRYEKIIVGGLSMGGVIAAIMGAQFSPDRLLLFAPAIRIRNPLLFLTPLVGALIPRRHVGYDESGISDPDKIELARRYYSYLWYRPAGHLYRLQRIVRRRMSGIQCPTMTVVSHADDTVPPEVADLVGRSIGASEHNPLILERSGHVLVNDTEKERVADAVLGWLSRNPTSVGEPRA
jgi:carboxylesterase